MIKFGKRVSWHPPGDSGQKPLKTSVRIAGNLTMISTGYMTNTSLDYYTNIPGLDGVIPSLTFIIVLQRITKVFNINTRREDLR